MTVSLFGRSPMPAIHTVVGELELAIQDAPVGSTSPSGENASPTGGPVTVRAYLEAAIPPVLDAPSTRAGSSTASCR